MVLSSYLFINSFSISFPSQLLHVCISNSTCLHFVFFLFLCLIVNLSVVLSPGEETSCKDDFGPQPDTRCHRGMLLWHANHMSLAGAQHSFGHCLYLCRSSGRYLLNSCRQLEVSSTAAPQQWIPQNYLHIWDTDVQNMWNQLHDQDVTWFLTELPYLALRPGTIGCLYFYINTLNVSFQLWHWISRKYCVKCTRFCQIEFLKVQQIWSSGMACTLSRKKENS